MIETLTESQHYSIKEYFKNNNIVDHPEQSLSVSNCDLYDCVENYKTINSVENDCIIQFATNAGGRTSYHYLKKDGGLYIIQAWMGDISIIYNVNDKWFNLHNQLLKNI